jgi:omega-6 fatty acid desaturase (delta-12 desaturase)
MAQVSAKKTDSSTEPLTLEMIKKAIPAHLFIKDEMHFLVHVVWSVSATLVLAYLAHQYIPLTLMAIPLWILYAIVNGTIGIGVWVLGHECGHGSFSDKQWANDLLGYFLHTPLLVPYFSWQHSHYVHHSRTNHVTEGESHVPNQIDSKAGKLYMKFRDSVGVDAWAIYQMFTVFVLGWPSYLTFGATGGPKRGFTSHFIVPNKLFPTNKLFKVGISNVGLLVMFYLLYIWAQKTCFAEVMGLYVGPYLIVNVWLTGYTWLQHSDETVAQYDETTWDWLTGAIATIDRNYPMFINTLHFEIGSTHVLHHIFSYMPHYNAREATGYLKQVLGKKYNYDGRKIWDTVWAVAKLGAVESKDEKGIYRYISKYPYYDNIGRY